MGSRAGLDDDKILALPDYGSSPRYDDRERAALEYADAMSAPGGDVADALFERLRRYFTDDALVELTALIAWENAASRFNHALRIPGQGLWTQGEGPGATPARSPR